MSPEMESLPVLRSAQQDAIRKTVAESELTSACFDLEFDPPHPQIDRESKDPLPFRRALTIRFIPDQRFQFALDFDIENSSRNPTAVGNFVITRAPGNESMFPSNQRVDSYDGVLPNLQEWIAAITAEIRSSDPSGQRAKEETAFDDFEAKFIANLLDHLGNSGSYFNDEEIVELKARIDSLVNGLQTLLKNHDDDSDRELELTESAEKMRAALNLPRNVFARAVASRFVTTVKTMFGTHDGAKYLFGSSRYLFPKDQNGNTTFMVHHSQFRFNKETTIPSNAIVTA